MVKKGVDFPQECLIFEVCQPQQAKKVLEQNMGVPTALATLKPTALLALFNTPQLAGVAREVEDTIVKIMQEAASSS